MLEEICLKTDLTNDFLQTHKDFFCQVQLLIKQFQSFPFYEFRRETEILNNLNLMLEAEKIKELLRNVFCVRSYSDKLF